jgi:hypothetical protein
VYKERYVHSVHTAIQYKLQILPVLGLAPSPRSSIPVLMAGAATAME